MRKTAETRNMSRLASHMGQVAFLSRLFLFAVLRSRRVSSMTNPILHHRSRMAEDGVKVLLYGQYFQV